MTLKDDLLSLYGTYRGHLPAEYRWEDEKDRWTELVYAIFAEQSGKGERDSRIIVSSLASLGALEFEKLAKALTDNGQLDMSNKLITNTIDILAMKGVKENAAKDTILSICQMAKAIQSKYGKLQIFLRSHAENMLKDLADTVPFTSIDDKLEKHIYITWMQNALELPIAGSDEYIFEFCKEKKCTLEELVAIADEIDVNVAILDDLVRFYLTDQNRIHPSA